ncbi:MAG: chloride channel protein [Steroidobacteraceae bacterium]
MAWLRRLVFWVGAISTGAVAVAFAHGADEAQALFRTLTERSAVWAFAAPPLGLALIVWLTNRFFFEARGSGIPQTIAALHLHPGDTRDRLLSLRNAAGKFFLTIGALACGASVGREGPTVQIGAAIMHSLGRAVRLPAAGVSRGLILAGGAAGVAAAFNTPLAGVVFAIEELSRSFEQKTSGIIFAAVILAGITSIALVGNYAYFGSTTALLAHIQDWVVVPVCGIAGGLAGGVFARGMLVLRRSVPHLIANVRWLNPITVALACGVILAALGWLSDGTTFGTGYEQARELLQQETLPNPWYALEKFAATLVSYAAGIPAGIFAPSLAVGAGLGGLISMTTDAAPVGAVVVLTMAAYFAGVVQAPLTALVIVSEMVGERALTLPLMAAAFVGRGSSALVCRESLYLSLSKSFLGTRQLQHVA